MLIEFCFTPNRCNGRKALHASCLVGAIFIMAAYELLKGNRVPLPGDIPPSVSKGTDNPEERLSRIDHV